MTTKDHYRECLKIAESHLAGVQGELALYTKERDDAHRRVNDAIGRRNTLQGLVQFLQHAIKDEPPDPVEF